MDTSDNFVRLGYRALGSFDWLFQRSYQRDSEKIMGDQYDKWFERGQRIGYEGQNLEVYIEKQIAESYDREERLRKLELACEKELSERRERKLANEAEKKAKRKPKNAKRKNTNARRLAVKGVKSSYFGCVTKRALTLTQPLPMVMQKHHGQRYPVLTNSVMISTLTLFALTIQ